MDERPAILLVDDQPTHLIALEAMLGGLGHHLIKVQSGRQALERLAPEVALVILDVHMPNLDGLQTAELIRRDAPETPIIFMTAATEPQKQAMAYSCGAVDWMEKPAQPAVLRAKVTFFVELWKKNRTRQREEQEARAKIAHELRTPLNAILGWVQILRSESVDETKRARALETIERNARAQAALIDDLLGRG